MSNRNPLYSTVRARPPTSLSFSRITTGTPRVVSSYPAARPAGPAPITTTEDGGCCFSLFIKVPRERDVQLERHLTSHYSAVFGQIVPAGGDLCLRRAGGRTRKANNACGANPLKSCAKRQRSDVY